MSLSGQLQAAALPTKTRVSWRQDGSVVTVRMSVGDEVVGIIHARKDSGGLKKCQADIDALKARGYSSDEFWFVDNVEIKEPHRGTGLGKQLYRTTFDAILQRQGRSIMGPHSCWLGSGTSRAARRVWDSLVKEYPSSGSVIVLGAK